MEPCSHFQQGTNPAAQFSPAFGGVGDARQDLQQGRLPRAVAPNEPDDVAPADLYGKVLERPQLAGCRARNAATELRYRGGHRARERFPEAWVAVAYRTDAVTLR